MVSNPDMYTLYSPIKPNKWCLMALDQSLKFISGSRNHPMDSLALLNSESLYYLDDFILAKKTPPLALYLGIEINTITMQACLSLEKLLGLKQESRSIKIVHPY